MNIEEYIASGILEAYVVGEVTAEERREVEKYLREYPELQAELDRVEEAQQQLLLRAAIAPRPAVKEKLFSALNTSPGMKEVPVVSIDSLKQKLDAWRWAAAASITIAAVALYFAVSYHERWRSSELSLNELLAQNQQVAEDYNRVNQRLDKIESAFNLMSDPAFRRVVMKGTPNAPEALASVYWSEASHAVYLNIQNLKALSQDKQYQLWAIVDGKPVDAGVFDVDLAGLIKMKDITGASAFAVTIEPKGGSVSPALETMQVMGNS